MLNSKRKRKLTPFLCQELLYDYAIDSLDQDRKAAVEEFLKENADCRKTLETIHKGFWYADQLSNFEVSAPMVERLEEAENVISIGQKVSSYTEYPDWLKWSLVALLSSGCVAIIVVLIPWTKIAAHFKPSDTHTVVLAPLSNQIESQDQTNQDQETADENDSSGDFDESGAPVEDDVATPTPKPTVAVKAKPQPQIIAKATVPPLATPSEVPEENEEEAVTGHTFNATTAANAEEKDDKSEAKPKGFVYRAFMNLANVEDVADQITQQIKELGGVKAGEVELGWKKGSLRYYHFILPESNQDKLLEALRAYGPVRISKDPHPRVMPPGEVRFILSIDAKQ